jgi:hypothetical protein
MEMFSELHLHYALLKKMQVQYFFADVNCQSNFSFLAFLLYTNLLFALLYFTVNYSNTILKKI